MLLFVLSVALSAGAVPERACAGKGTRLVVDTATHRLFLCAENREELSFSIRIGGKGTGKTRQGDAKTPLGIYSVDPPRKSEKFGTFVPIGYPTVEQRKAGFTGSAVGIHGPHRWIEWAGRLNNLIETTAGCIGLDSDEAMKALSDWMKARKPKQIQIK